MTFNEFLENLNDFDINDINFENIGSWPLVAKVFIWSLIFCAVLGGGYWFHVKELQADLAKQTASEEKLRKEFKIKAQQAVNLDAYKQQMREMEESFGALLAQLPSDTEVPGLLEDITNKGLESGLVFHSILLQDEKSEEFYIELPIEIIVEGAYHELGAFVSGVAGMPRIVTLHDFSMEPTTNSALKMSITAKTYRYKNDES